MFLVIGLTFIAAFQSSLSSECPPHSCLESQTCCVGSDAAEYGCCAIPDAVCCPSGTYCCPQGSSCDESQSTCVLDEPDHEPLGDHVEISATEAETHPEPFSKRLGDHAEVAVDTSDEAVNFCDDRNYCPKSMTCCQTTDGGHGCCPFDDSVCCPDMNHCCPSDQECDASSKGCIKKADPTKLVKHVNLP